MPLGIPAGSQGTSIEITGTGFTANSVVRATASADATVTLTPTITSWTSTKLIGFVEASPFQMTGTIIVSDGGVDSSPVTITIAAAPGP